MTPEEMEAKIKEIEENYKTKIKDLEAKSKEDLETKEKELEEIKKKKLELELISKGKEFKDDVPEEEEILTFEKLFKNNKMEDLF